MSEKQNDGLETRSSERSFPEVGVACGILFAIVTATAFRGQAFFSMLQPPSTAGELPHYILQIVLFFELLSLSVAWVGATQHELRMWRQWLGVDHYYISDVSVYLAVFGVSVVLGLMFLFAYEIASISLYMALYWFFNVWTQNVANEHFRELLASARERRLSEEHERILCVMEEYWLQRPQLRRITVMALSALTAFALALAGLYATFGTASAWPPGTPRRFVPEF